MSTITVNSPAKVAAPRGARVAGVWFAALLNAAQQALNRRAERRAQAGRQAESARVRVQAQRIAQQDPRFAADLLAAADRHERG